MVLTRAVQLAAQLPVARQDMLMYFNFFIRNVSKFVRNAAWWFLTISTTTSYEHKHSYKQLFRRDVSTGWVNISSIKVCR
jgi:hypothetical protein